MFVWDVACSNRRTGRGLKGLYNDKRCQKVEFAVRSLSYPLYDNTMYLPIFVFETTPGFWLWFVIESSLKLRYAPVITKPSLHLMVSSLCSQPCMLVCDIKLSVSLFQEPHRVYPSIPAKLRRPLRVLSLFDGIATGVGSCNRLIGVNAPLFHFHDTCYHSLVVGELQ